MTRLTALELFGFKSFADRTRFEFPAGITVVVGPNGSGKSNVVDAIKWVLGEQSVRSLRGKEMTDVIFAGSASRKPLNMAEVSLIFDNSARELSVTTDAVQISRRVYRNGESEYLLNGEPARLRDIRELFSGTGAATEAYSVIEQGRVDALLVASGRDRRAVFEEAAGITRFRSRRAEALRRLERAEQNRQRLADIVGEVSSRLETVRHQAARARRWKTMQDRLRRFRVAAAGRDLAGVDASIATVDESLQLARHQAADNEAASTELAAASATIARSTDDLQPRLAAARAAAASGQQRLAAAEATETLVRGRRGEFEAEVAQAAAAVAEARVAEREAAEALRAAEAAVAEIATSLASLRASLSSREAVAAGSHLDATSARASLATATAVADDLARRHLRLEADHDRAAEAVHDARAAATEARDRLAEARSRHATLGESRSACEGHLASLDARLRSMVAAVESLQANQREAGDSLRKAWAELAGWRATLEACRERRTVLADVVQRHEGVSEAARRLLADEIAASIPGLSGVLADLVVAGVEWAPLVDLALGELGQSLVVDSLDEAVGWHAAWASTPEAAEVLAAGGRIGFLAPRGLRDPDAFEPDPHPGLVGRLDRLIAADRPDAIGDEVVRRLLGRVWVVERIEHALPTIATAPPGTLFLTRDGVSLVADGGFTVGSPSAATGLVARRSELRALDERHAELTRTVADAQREIDALQAAIDSRAADIVRADAARQAAAEQLVSARVDLTRVGRDEHAAREAILRAEEESRRADQRVVLADAAAETSRRERDDLAARLDEAHAEAARCRAAIEAVERDRGAAIDEIQRLRIDEASTAEKRARLEDAAAATAARLTARRDEVTAAGERLDLAVRRADRHLLDLLAASSARAEASWIAETAGAALAALTAKSRDLETERQRVASDVEAARATATRLAEQLHALELQAGEARHQRARILERIRDEYDIDIAATPPDVPADAEAEPVPDDRDELEARIEELRRKLGGMTSVNLEALRESEELAERLAKLEAQLADVTSARESIETLIARIDDESRRLLGETIDTVRGHFRDLFERVFGGGQADIVLEEGVDLLDAAVEIVARPPGKEPRGISLLSGGEKTMTCVALLLAIFKSRPSPFCVLDEVDAALDEANVDRFVGVLRDFLSSTQFIVVTHSKKTMASATTLYGVTMEESGVSKRVSVRFESSEAAARPSSRAA